MHLTQSWFTWGFIPWNLKRKRNKKTEMCGILVVPTNVSWTAGAAILHLTPAATLFPASLLSPLINSLSSDVHLGDLVLTRARVKCLCWPSRSPDWFSGHHHSKGRWEQVEGECKPWGWWGCTRGSDRKQLYSSNLECKKYLLVSFLLIYSEPPSHLNDRLFHLSYCRACPLLPWGM